MYKQSRRSGAKVKTGCKTCKIRRVKCDENKPSCLRCTSTGRCCDGYTSPKEDFQVQVWSQRTPHKSISLLSGFGDSIRYLEYYHHCVRPLLSNNFDSEFWSRITLQMACSEPAVRHALIALAYLFSSETGSLKHARSKFASQQESRILLYHYNKSVRGLVDRIGEATYTPEVGLVTCLLFVCMEFLRGNHHTAFTHLTNGLKIIFENRKQIQHDSHVSPPSKAWEISSTKRSLPTSALIEEELKPMFIREITAALMYGVDLDDILCINSPSLQYYQCLRFENIRKVESSAHELRNLSILQIQHVIRKLFFSPETPFTPEELSKQAYVLDCQRAWYTALQRFQHAHHLSKSEELVISTLLTHYHAIHISVACAIEVSQMPFDDHLEAFKVILHHATLILDSMDLKPSQSAARYTFEMSIIPALFFVGTRCRCPSTRREAVSLLARNPPREGLWDASQKVVVVNRVIEIEEKEVDPTTGWPVPHTRLWSCVINADMDRNGGFWAYFMPVDLAYKKTPDGKQMALQEFFVLDDEPLPKSCSSLTPL